MSPLILLPDGRLAIDGSGPDDWDEIIFDQPVPVAEEVRTKVVEDAWKEATQARTAWEVLGT